MNDGGSAAPTPVTGSRRRRVAWLLLAAVVLLLIDGAMRLAAPRAVQALLQPNANRRAVTARGRLVAELDLAGAVTRLDTPFTLACRKPSSWRLDIGRHGSSLRSVCNGIDAYVVSPLLPVVWKLPAPQNHHELWDDILGRRPRTFGFNQYGNMGYEFLPPESLGFGLPGAVTSVRRGLPAGAWFRHLPRPWGTQAVTVTMEGGLTAAVWVGLWRHRVRQVAMAVDSRYWDEWSRSENPVADEPPGSELANAAEPPRRAELHLLLQLDQFATAKSLPLGTFNYKPPAGATVAVAPPSPGTFPTAPLDASEQRLNTSHGLLSALLGVDLVDRVVIHQPPTQAEKAKQQAREESLKAAREEAEKTDKADQPEGTKGAKKDLAAALKELMGGKDASGKTLVDIPVHTPTGEERRLRDVLGKPTLLVITATEGAAKLTVGGQLEANSDDHWALLKQLDGLRRSGRQVVFLFVDTTRYAVRGALLEQHLQGEAVWAGMLGKSASPLWEQIGMPFSTCRCLGIGSAGKVVFDKAGVKSVDELSEGLAQLSGGE
jgi:hypothetical protein